ncbi:MAG: DedA family protein [Gemmatimonadales bacterium]
MELLKDFVDLFLHLDRHLSDLIAQYGTWTYAILFLIIFCETGLVVTPFLPGDSLIFAAGTFAGMGSYHPGILFLLLFSASVLGDSTNYWVGRYIGPRAFSGNFRFLKREYLDKTRDFYTRHGAQTVIVARFLPIIRTFAPFVAGVGEMPYARFVSMSLIGSAAWVGLFVGAGYFFGNLPVVRQNFSLVVMAIIAISLLPMAIEILKAWLAKRSAG